MREQKRVFMLVILMILATGVVGATVFTFLYRAAMSEERGRLTETIRSQASLIKSIARSDLTYKAHLPGGSIKATIASLIEAHQKYESFRKTGTFTMARRHGDSIVYLLVHCGKEIKSPISVPWRSNFAEPMRRALSGESGTMVGLDYQGRTVLAAYEPVAVLGLGIVAKIDLSEVRAPFVRAGFLAGFVTLLVSTVAAFLFLQITRPMITQMENHALDLEKTLSRLTESEERSRQMIERNPDTVLIVDDTGEVLFANPASENLFGLSLKALKGIQFGLPAKDEDSSEISIAGRDGRERTIEMRSESIRWADQDAVIISMRDVTERKEAADRIGRLNEALRAIRAVDQLITREKDPGLLIKSACEILYARGRFRGVWIALRDEKGKSAAIAEVGMEGAFQKLRRCLENGEYPPCFEKASHEIHTLLVNKNPETCGGCPVGSNRSDEGALLLPLIQGERHFGILVIAGPLEMLTDEEDQGLLREAADDIAFALKSIEVGEKQERFQRALRQSEKRFRLLIENAPIGILVVDTSGVMLECNEKGFEILKNISADAVSSKNLLEFPSLVDGGIVKEINRCMETAEVINRECPLKGESGRKIHLRYHLAPMRDAEDAISAVQAIIEDISETRDLEAQLRQAQKMEAIGTLAGGIAHDFNNILSAIFGYSQLFLMGTSKDSAQYANVEEILKACERARDLVKQILTFSRQAETEKFPLQPHPIIKEAVKLLRSTIPTSIEIRQRIFKSGMILADPTQLHQVVMNLCTNAYQAMRGRGGVLEIGLKDTRIDEGDELLDVFGELKSGPHVCLTIKDTGPGITPEVLEQIFDPYFTTKEKGKGTGLGLSVVHGIVVGLGGAITVESATGDGTTFRVFFPILKEKADSEPKKADMPLFGGNERILLVDDERPIVKLGKQLLEQLGYRVETTVDSLDALKRFVKAPDAYDLLVTDMTMPNMSGEELAAEIKRIRPDLPVIICTGHSDLMDEEKAEAQGLNGFLMKPLSRETIAKAVRSVLDT